MKKANSKTEVPESAEWEASGYMEEQTFGLPFRRWKPRYCMLKRERILYIRKENSICHSYHITQAASVHVTIRPARKKKSLSQGIFTIVDGKTRVKIRLRVFGDEEITYWTQHLCNKRKNKFDSIEKLDSPNSSYNPSWDWIPQSLRSKICTNLAEENQYTSKILLERHKELSNQISLKSSSFHSRATRPPYSLCHSLSVSSPSSNQTIKSKNKTLEKVFKTFEPSFSGFSYSSQPIQISQKPVRTLTNDETDDNKTLVNSDSQSHSFLINNTSRCALVDHTTKDTVKKKYCFQTQDRSGNANFPYGLPADQSVSEFSKMQRPLIPSSHQFPRRQVFSSWKSAVETETEKFHKRSSLDPPEVLLLPSTQHLRQQIDWNMLNKTRGTVQFPNTPKGGK